MQWSNSLPIGSNRRVTPERLDDLAPDDPLALRSRLDLQRVHRAMGSLWILQRAVSKLLGTRQPQSILELGGGDGTLLLRLARAIHPRWVGVQLTILDRHDLVTAETRRAYASLDWHVSVICADIAEWAQTFTSKRYNICVTTLFLHHFEDALLRLILRRIANRTDAFIACEPRRNGWSRIGSRAVGLLGANQVTREDAIASVAAGFAGFELTALWPSASEDWFIDEYPAWPFTHCFVVARAGRKV